MKCSIPIYRTINDKPCGLIGCGPDNAADTLFDMIGDILQKGIKSECHLSSCIDKEEQARVVGEIVIQDIQDDTIYTIKAHEVAAKPDVNRKPDGAPGTMVIQSIVFSVDEFTPESARQWLSSHDGVSDYGIETTLNRYRFRQYDPQWFDTFRARPLDSGITAIFGRIAGSRQTTEQTNERVKDAFQKMVDVEAMNALIIKRGLQLIQGSEHVVQKAEQEERYIKSLVLEPTDGGDGKPVKPDTQNDVYSAEEIRKTAHGWMENYGNVDLQHNWEAISKDKVRILECFIAPCDYKEGEHQVKKGSWMLALRVLDDKLWKAIKGGEIGAYSIGGVASRTPVGAEV